MGIIHWAETKIWAWSLRRIKARDDDAAKKAILAAAVAHLYNTITADDILRQLPNGQWMFRGRVLQTEEMAQLRDDAAILQRMKLWQVLRYDVRYQLSRKMFEEAKVPLDVVWGQLLTYLDDIMRTRLKKIGAITEQ